MHNPFDRVTPNPDQNAMMAAISQKCASLYADIRACVPDSRYKDEALLQLEMVGMLASKGITHGIPKKEKFT